jgi:hypothetical protein
VFPLSEKRERRIHLEYTKFLELDMMDNLRKTVNMEAVARKLESGEEIECTGTVRRLVKEMRKK